MTIMTVLLSVIVGVVYYVHMPQRYFVCFPLIPLYFFVLGWMNINILLFLFKNQQQHFVAGFMACKGFKFLSSLVLVVVYGLTVRQEILAFTLLFLAFYISFLVFETQFFLRVELRIKRNELKVQRKSLEHDTAKIP